MPTGSNDDESDEPAIPRTISEDDVQSATARHRAITPTDAHLIASATAKATAKRQESMSERERFRMLELQNAEWFGVDGDGGRIHVMSEDIQALKTGHNVHSGQISQLIEFKARLLWIGGVAVTVGGALAALAFKLIDHILK